MSVSKVIEITSESNKDFEDAIHKGIDRAEKTLRNIQHAWIENQSLVIEDGKITKYCVEMKITFMLKE